MKSLTMTLLAAVFGVFAACAACAENPEKLTKSEAEATAAALWQQKQAATAAEYGPMWDEKVFTLGDLMMPFDYTVFGDKPEGGRSLYISMHGGGNAPAAVNDQQWENQKRLYTVDEGVYLAPRAPVNDWNMWFRPQVDTLFEMIIRTAAVKMDVNPNKVYLTGYSAGGDGVWRLGPRMADHWAAAAMMAGHPGEISLENVRNIGFTIWMGADDAAYDRNALAVEFGQRLDSLQAADPEGYIHQTHIMEGMGHWMNRADTAGVAWMAGFVRNPYPDRVVWRQEESNPRGSFYYLSVPAEEAKGGMEVRVDKHGNTIEILKNDYSTLCIGLNDKMMDLDKPVTVICEGKQIFRGKVARKTSHIASSIEQRADPEYIFSAVLVIENGKVEVL